MLSNVEPRSILIRVVVRMSRKPGRRAFALDGRLRAGHSSIQSVAAALSILPCVCNCAVPPWLKDLEDVLSESCESLTEVLARTNLGRGNVLDESHLARFRHLPHQATFSPISAFYPPE